MKCKVCNSVIVKVFSAGMLHKYEVSYFLCSECGFLQTENPFWLKEAYSRPVNPEDTGYLARNINFSKKLTILFCLFFNKDARFVDYAAGYGVLVRLMRDIGFDFYWADKYTENLFAKGFEWQDGWPKAELVTAFECFEHFVQPMEEIENLLSLSDSIVFSTEILPKPLPQPDAWWYYGLDHGQHISFYTNDTLEYIANKFGLKYYSSRDFHILTKTNNLSNAMLKILKLERFGLHRIFQRGMRSKTWGDFLALRSLRGP